MDRIFMFVAAACAVGAIGFLLMGEPGDRQPHVGYGPGVSIIGTPLQPAGTPPAALAAVQLASTPSPPDTLALEQAMFALVNRDRADPQYLPETKGRAKPLAWDEDLAQVARAHAEDMSHRDFFDHYNPEGLGPADRITRAGIPWHSVRENLAMYDDVAAAQAAFMAEPPFEENHRANVLADDVDRVGIGVHLDPDGRTLWIVQDFRTP